LTFPQLLQLDSFTFGNIPATSWGAGANQTLK
jgi:hypothetical protein